MIVVNSITVTMFRRDVFGAVYNRRVSQIPNDPSVRPSLFPSSREEENDGER